MSDTTALRAAVEQAEIAARRVDECDGFSRFRLATLVGERNGAHVALGGMRADIHALLDENKELRAKLDVAKAAPHAFSCANWQNGGTCDCWKAKL